MKADAKTVAEIKEYFKLYDFRQMGAGMNEQNLKRFVELRSKYEGATTSEILFEYIELLELENRRLKDRIAEVGT